jgi:2-polyprenyl-6-methoxyphenol hydroxylase-like FAD-dependent oxidoreductase
VADDGNGGRRHGNVIAHLPVPRDDQSLIVGRTPFVTLMQSKLAKLFLDEARVTSLVIVYFNMELAAIQDDGDSVMATFTRVDTGIQETDQAAFLIGANGGKSAIRKLLNIPFKATPGLNDLCR